MQTPPHAERTCASCQADLSAAAAFRLRARGGAVLKCTRCSFIDAPLVGRSARVAAVVGTALVALNQGGLLLAGTFPWATGWWKVVLTYCVPFCVSTYGALSNGYRPASRSPEPSAR